MALFKHRPKIALLLQREIYPGGSYNAQVVITARREVPVDWLKVSLDGEERGTIGSGQSRRMIRRTVLGLGARLSGPRTLPEGRTELPFRFDIPKGLPPSYRGQSCVVEYVASIHASIPWWPDARSSFDVFVSTPPLAAPEDAPILFSSDPSGPRAREPHIEGSLVSSSVAVGGVVEGALALNNVGYNPYTSLEIGLVGIEEILSGGAVKARTEAHRYGLVLPVEAAVEGARLPFSFRVPEALIPTTTSQLWRLSWAFEVRARIRWRQDLHFRVPVTVIPASSAASRPRRSYHAPPTVGSERVEQLWRAVAGELGLRYETGRLSESIGQVSFEVIREHRGRRGVFLVALLTYPELYLGLRLAPRDSSLHRLVAGVFSGDDFDGRYDLSGRDADQVAFVSELLQPWVSAFTTVRADDRQATVEVHGSGQRRDKLREFVVAVRAFAAALDGLRTSIPPPRAMREVRPAWDTLASRLGGTLETARMVVCGHFHAMPAEVRTEWRPDGAAERTLLVLRPSMAIGREHEIHLSPAPSRAGGAECRPVLEDLPAAKRSIRGLLEPILEEAYSFDLSEDEVRLSLPAPQLEPLKLLDRLVLMAQLCELARAGKGPFR